MQFSWHYFRIERLTGLALPLLLGAATSIMTIIPWPWFHISLIAPSFVLVNIFYWSLLRPDLLPLPSLMLIGFFADLLSGGLFGANAFLILCFWPVLYKLRGFFLTRPFVAVWLYFGAFCFFYLLMLHLLHVIFMGVGAEFGTFFYRVLACFLTMPPIFYIITILHRTMIRLVGS